MTVELASDHSSRSHKPLTNKPDKTNWVEKAGGLPSYIERIARHLVADSGMSQSHAIAAAVNTVKRWAAGGGDVTPATKAKAAKALAEWEAKKAGTRASRGLSVVPDQTESQRGVLLELAARYSDRRSGVSGTTAGLAVDELARRRMLKKAIEASRASAPPSKEIERQKTAIERTSCALSRAKPGGAVAQRMTDRLDQQEADLADMSERAVELAYNKNQPRWPKGTPKAGQWMDNLSIANYHDFKMPKLTTPEEHEGVKAYGYAWGYKTINPFLHQGGKVFDSSVMGYVDATPKQAADAKKWIKGLDSAFAKAEPTKAPVTVFRRTGDNVFGPDVESKIGTTFVSKSYSSTMAKEGASMGHGFGYESKPHLWEIQVPAGTKALPGNDFEKEVILPRNGAFTIVGVQDLGDGQKKIQVTFAPAAEVVDLSGKGHDADIELDPDEAPKYTGPTAKNKHGGAQKTHPKTESQPPAAAEKKAPVPKNSIKYWERALEKTIEAQNKQPVGGKLWKKLDERRVDQGAMIAYMKAKNNPHALLSENEWKTIKPTLAGKTTGDMAAEAKDVSTPAAEPDLGGIAQKKFDANGAAQQYAELSAKMKGKTAYVHYDEANDKYTVSGDEPTAAMNVGYGWSGNYHAIKPDGSHELKNTKFGPSAYKSDDTAQQITEQEFDFSFKAKDYALAEADATGQNAYMYFDNQKDAFVVSGKPPEAGQDIGLNNSGAYKMVAPDGTITGKNLNKDAPAPVPPSPAKEHFTVPWDAQYYAEKWAKDSGAPHYAYGSSDGGAYAGHKEPTVDDTPTYVKVSPDGTKEYKSTSGMAVPQPAAPTTTGSSSSLDKAVGYFNAVDAEVAAKQIVKDQNIPYAYLVKDKDAGLFYGVDKLPEPAPHLVAKKVDNFGAIGFFDPLEKVEPSKFKSSTDGLQPKTTFDTPVQATKAAKALAKTEMKSHFMFESGPGKWTVTDKKPMTNDDLGDADYYTEVMPDGHQLFAQTVPKPAESPSKAMYGSLPEAMKGATALSSSIGKDYHVYQNKVGTWVTSDKAPTSSDTKNDAYTTVSPDGNMVYGHQVSGNSSNKKSYTVGWKASDSAKMLAETTGKTHYKYIDIAGNHIVMDTKPTKNEAPHFTQFNPDGTKYYDQKTGDAVKPGSDSAYYKAYGESWKAYDAAQALAKADQKTYYKYQSDKGNHIVTNIKPTQSDTKTYIKFNPGGLPETELKTADDEPAVAYGYKPDAIAAAKGLALDTGKSAYVWLDNNNKYKVSSTTPDENDLAGDVMTAVFSNGITQAMHVTSDTEPEKPVELPKAKTMAQKLGIDEQAFKVAPGVSKYAPNSGQGSFDFAYNKALKAAESLQHSWDEVYLYKSTTTGKFGVVKNPPKWGTDYVTFKKTGLTQYISPKLKWTPEKEAAKTHAAATKPATPSAPSTPSAGSNLLNDKPWTNVDFAESWAKTKAVETGKPVFVYWDGNKNGYVAAKDTSSLLNGKQYKRIEPNGQVHTYTKGSQDEIKANTTGVHKKSFGSSGAAMGTASKQSLQNKKDQYVWKDPETDKFNVTDELPTGIGTMYTTYSNGINQGSKVIHDGAVKTIKTPDVHDLGPAEPQVEAVGPKTDFVWQNEDVRPLGLDAQAIKQIKEYIAGSPESKAMEHRFSPSMAEVATHYIDAGARQKATGGKAAVRAYTGSHSGSVNRPLRGQEKMTPEAAKRIQQIDKAMAAYKTKEPMIVNRGVNANALPENLAGKMIQDGGYMSTAIGKTGFGGNVNMHIFVPAGTHGIPTHGIFDDGGTHPNENEFILPRGTMMLISKDEMVGGTRHVTGTVVPIPKDAPQLNGVVQSPDGVTDGGYSTAGLEYLRLHGREAWKRRYAKNKELALSRQTWYNSPVTEAAVVVIRGGPANGKDSP